MKKAKISHTFTPQTVLAAVANVTQQNKAIETETGTENAPFSLDTPVMPIEGAKKAKEKERKTKITGRPEKFAENEKRVPFNTMMHPAMVRKLKHDAINRNCSSADILDEILKKYFN